MNMWRGLWFVVWVEVSFGAACVCGQGRAGLMVAVMARGAMTSRLNVSIGAVAKLATSGRCPDKLVAQTVAPFFPRCWHLTGAPISAGPPLPTNACVSEEFAPDEPVWGERGYAPGLMFCLLVAMGSMTPDLETRAAFGVRSCDRAHRPVGRRCRRLGWRGRRPWSFART